MTGVAGLLENFSYYYERIMNRQVDSSLTMLQRNSIYEQYRMAEAFYLCALREKDLAPNKREELEFKFIVLTEQIRNIQQIAGDLESTAFYTKRKFVGF